MRSLVRDSYTFFISDKGIRSRSFYSTVFFGSICGVVSIVAGDNDITVAATTVLATSVAFWVHFLLYLHSKQSIHAEVRQTITRRISWRLITAFAMSSLSVTAIAAAKSLGRKKALLVADDLNEEALAALKSYSLGQPSTVQLKDLSDRAQAAHSVFAGQRSPLRVVEAVINSRVAAIASRLTLSPMFSHSSAKGISGAGASAIVIGQDALIVDFTCVGGSPKSGVTGITLINDPAVLVYNSSFENVTQVIGHIVWVNTAFKNCIVKYSGGPILVSGVRFENCSLDTSMASASGFSNLIRTHNNGSKISFSSGNSTP